jgi:hypothetical protein
MINVEHLLDLADEESAISGAGAPRQANLRRAISTAYYAAFHELLGNIAETFVPAAHQKSRAIFLRALDHSKARERCKKLGQNPLPNDKRMFFGWTQFPVQIRLFATEFVNLQEMRHQADYDPEIKFSAQEARDTVDSARKAIVNLRNAPTEYVTPFLSYVLLGLRK